MCVQLDVLHNTDTFRHEKCGGAADIDLTPIQHSDHSAPGAIFGAIAPAIRNIKTYPVIKNINSEFQVDNQRNVHIFRDMYSRNSSYRVSFLQTKNCLC